MAIIAICLLLVIGWICWYYRAVRVGSRYHRGAWLAVPFAIVLLVLGLNAVTNNGATASKPTKPDSGKPNLVALEDPGPGRCVPANDILAHLRKEKPGGHDFRPPYNKAELKTAGDVWIAWIEDNLGKSCVKAMARSVGVQPAQFPKWLRTNLLLKELKAPLTVQNSYFDHKDGHLIWWKVQTFPAGELIWFTKSGEPVFKYVCGNRLRPLNPRPPPRKPTSSRTPSPSVTPSPTKTPIDNERGGPGAVPSVTVPPGPSGAPASAPPTASRSSDDPDGGAGNDGATRGPGPDDDRDSGMPTSPTPNCNTGNPDDCP